ncbi:hypothetical protein EJ06DRAFT_246433 [Trichodelitschia bisporula]|uniref:Uncharacterized protein n=1 Tax=Trichodelitschia bisporula TaxID=703511 RepID=A0A6G1HK00_9PEZI|nr:hypothetical protein EJ06DRAFT_246433 [Trichodelitschia bisporula]
MVLEYFTSRLPTRGTGKDKSDTSSPAAAEGPKSPVLTDEDEAFLHQITSEDEHPPPLPERPVVILPGEVKSEEDKQTALEGAEKVPLPTSPPPNEKEAGKDKEVKEGEKSTMPANFKKDKSKGKEKAHSPVVEAPPPDPEAEKQDITRILDDLNLAAVNNRVFSFSEESQKLMEQFTQILKDIVNGVPTAYDDLEKLLTNSDHQLRKLYGGLPPFLQALIKSLPTKVTGSLAPAVMAAASEKPGADAQAMGIDTATAGAKLRKRKMPSLKSLVTKQGAVTGMLRSILNFLKLRFPALITGTNVLMSLAVFLLLFVFWYCHKRGREVRLEKENLGAEAGEGSGSVSVSEVESEEEPERPVLQLEPAPPQEKLPWEKPQMPEGVIPLTEEPAQKK